jgi:RNA polymerase sigma factor (TIGR02999 family)
LLKNSFTETSANLDGKVTSAAGGPVTGDNHKIMAGDVTRLLEQVRSGSKQAEADLMELVYPELRRIAGRYLSKERPAHTLQPTALVNETYFALTGQYGKAWQNRSHFYAVAAQLMRRILVDHARNRKAHKREGNRQKVELTERLAFSDIQLDRVLAIDAALDRLAEFAPRAGQVVVLRFFGGLTEDEVAEVLQVTSRTVKRDWNAAKAWLYSELHPQA